MNDNKLKVNKINKVKENNENKENKDNKDFNKNKVNQNKFNKSNIEHDKTFLRIKDSLYNTIYYILKFDKISIYMIIFLNIIETLQLLSYSFHPIFGSVWKVSGYEDLFDLFSAFLNIFKMSNKSLVSRKMSLN